MTLGQGQEIGPRSRNDLDLQYSHMFIFSVSFRSQAAKVLKNQQFSLFPIEKPKLPNLTLPWNRSKSTQGHHLYKLWWAGVPEAKYQVSWKSVHRFRRRRFLMVLSIFEHGGYLGHVTWIIYINFRSPFPRRLHMKFGFDWSSGFRGEEVWKCGRTTTTTDDRRRTTDAGPWVYYKLTLWA